MLQATFIFAVKICFASLKHGGRSFLIYIRYFKLGLLVSYIMTIALNVNKVINNCQGAWWISGM